jgi:dienelactone hydrolase
MRAPRAAIAFALLVAACGRDAPGVAPVASASATPPPGPASACRPDEARCASDAEPEVCLADGSGWVRRTCEGDSICLAGKCPSLVTPNRREVIDRSRLLATVGEGWLGAWAIAAPLSLRTVQRFQEAKADPFAEGVLGSWKSACSAEPAVRILAGKDERQNPPAYAVLAGYLVSPVKRPVQIKAGASGRLAVWLNGHAVVDVSGPGGTRPLKDEAIGVGELTEGVNLVALIVEQLEEQAPSFTLRLHDLGNRVLDDVLFAPLVPQAQCSAAELLSVTPVVRPVARGFEVDLQPRFFGLVPRPVIASGKLALQAELRREDGKPAQTPSDATSHEPAAADLCARGARVLLPVTPPKRGRYELSISAGGGEVRKIPVAYAGEVHERIVALRELAGSAPRWAAPEGSRDSFVHHVDRLVRALAGNETDHGWLDRTTQSAEALGAALAAGEDPYATKTGYVQRAYRSKIDGQLHPYLVHVPRYHKPDGKPLPLVLAFHGRDRLPEHALRTVVGEAPDDSMPIDWFAKHLPGIGDMGAILAAPFGHGNEGPRGMGEEDALRVLEEMKKAYRIDDRRVSVTGYSLGGTVSFVLPLHYPDLFAASAPLCGYPNLTTYESIRTVRHMPWEDVLVSKRYIVNYAENGLHVPMRIVHGGQDGPHRSQVVADRYRDLGYTHIFDVQDELDHNVWDYAYEDGKMIGWLKARRRPAVPERVRLATADYRYDRAYWVQLHAMRESLKFAQIDATWSEKEQRVTVTTSNVAELGLEIGLLSPQGGATATIDGVELPLPVGERTATFERSEGTWRSLPAPRSRPGFKRHGVAGPLDDVIRHPLWIVYGTQDATQTETNRMVADHLALYDGFSGGRFPVKADMEVAEVDLQDRSVMLIGNPVSNKLTALLAPALPVQFERTALTLRGKRYEGEDVGVSLIQPNPRDADEYVVLHAGVGHRGTLAARHLPMLAPDYLVYDKRITVQRGDLLLDKRTVLDGGFFGDDWK